MTRHYMRLRRDPFEAILCGRKSVEVRLYDEKRRKIRPGDEIEFTEEEGERRVLLVKVTGIRVFPGFKELYESFPPEKLGYLPEAAQSAKYTDMEEYYSKEEQEKYGAVGIMIEMMNG